MTAQLASDAKSIKYLSPEGIFSYIYYLVLVYFVSFLDSSLFLSIIFFYVLERTRMTDLSMGCCRALQVTKRSLITFLGELIYRIRTQVRLI